MAKSGEMLSSIEKEIREKVVRKQDKLISYNDSHFLLILEESRAKEAAAVALRLKTVTGKCTFDEGTVTAIARCQTGVATYPTDCGSSRILIEIAMDRSKEKPKVASGGRI